MRIAQIWAPIVLGVLGVAALVGGVLLLRRRRGAPDADPDREPPVRADDRALA